MSATVHVVDDDAALRDALAILLRGAGLRVQGYASGPEFLARARLEPPCCLLVDLQMPHMSGSELIARLRGRGVRCPVIFVTAHGSVRLAVEEMKRGAFDFIEKPFRHEALLERVQRALAADAAAPRPRLTAREREVLELVLEGRSSRAIGEALGLSAKTVEFHRANLMRKFGARSLAGLFRACLKD